MGRYFLAWAAVALYLLRFVDRGWVPHDEGMLAQIAERILGGEMPHRDFDDPYTGGLGYLHAMGFMLFGSRILSLRILLFLATLAWIPAVFEIARRFVPPAVAALITATAVVWTVPNYFASMPSYYNLFFATWGTVALLRHVDTNSRTWLFIAGLCGGLSFLVKASGLYFVGGAAIFLLYREQLDNRGAGKQSLAIFGTKAAFGLLFVMSLGVLVRARPGASEFLHFFVPGTSLIAVLLWSEWAGGGGAATDRIRRAAELVAPFLLGVALPVTLFLIPYLMTHTFSMWYQGVFVVPKSRFQSAAADLPALVTVLAALPYGLVLIADASHGFVVDRRWRIVLSIPAILIAVLAVTGGTNESIYRSIWYSARHLTIPLTIACCMLLVSRKNGLSLRRRQELFLLAVLAALMPLVQIPFGAAIYFCYAAPFLLLATLAAVRCSATKRLWPHGVLLAGYCLFAVLWTNTNYVWTLGAYPSRYSFVAASILTRAGITMTTDDRLQYSNVVSLIQQANHRNRYIYAGPDCPEVYFLSGTSNPTRTLYEFLGSGNHRETLDLIERLAIDVVVINRAPGFSGPLDPGLTAAFEQRFPYSAEAGRFLVRWRL